MADLDVAELARDLKATATAMDRHIKAEAAKRAAELGRTYARAADERIRDKDVELQRAQAVIAEFRRQREPLERAANMANHIATVVRRAHWAGETVIDVKTLLDIVNSATKEPS